MGSIRLLPFTYQNYIVYHYVLDNAYSICTDCIKLIQCICTSCSLADIPEDVLLGFFKFGPFIRCPHNPLITSNVQD